MDITENLCGLLAEKKQWFEKYQACTEALETCDIDDIEDYITKRTQYAIEIDKIDEAIGENCLGENNGALLHAAAFNRCDFEDVPESARLVFERAQEIFAIIFQIQEREPMILERMKTLREDLREKIRERQNVPKIAKYLGGLAVRPENGRFLGGQV